MRSASVRRVAGASSSLSISSSSTVRAADLTSRTLEPSSPATLDLPDPVWRPAFPLFVDMDSIHIRGRRGTEGGAVRPTAAGPAPIGAGPAADALTRCVPRNSLSLHTETLSIYGDDLSAVARDRPQHIREAADRLARGMESAVLAFPLTPFDTAGDFAPDAFSAYLDYQLANGPGALFVACGTGEFSSLGTDDYEAVVRTAVQRVGGRLPVIAGAGYGARLAADFARAAERAGADGVLLLPPYLLSGPQAGLVEHTRAVAAATRLPVIAYQRNQVAYTPDSLAELAAVPNLIGLKDGHG